MSEALQTVAELELDLADLRIARQKLVQEKGAIEAMLAEVNVSLKARLPHDVYVKKSRQRSDIIRQIADKLGEIMAINQRLTELQARRDFRKQQDGTLGPEDVRLLVGIRDRWHEFSMDPAQHAKARQAAFQFSQELRAVLKKHFA